MPLIQSEPKGKKSHLRFEIDTETKQTLVFYCEFSQNTKPDPVIMGALKMLFKADTEFGPWLDQKRRQLPSEKQAQPQPKPTLTRTDAAEGKRSS